MSACQTTSKHQQIVGRVITLHHPLLSVSARIGLAKVHTNCKMVEHMVLNPDINRITHTHSIWQSKPQQSVWTTTVASTCTNLISAHQESNTYDLKA